MSAVGRALCRGFRAFGTSIRNDLPDRPRFIACRLSPPDFFDHVEADNGRYRWGCPDPNFQWHYGVDDCGYFEKREDAYAALAHHWGIHHTMWNGFPEDHEAWDKWSNQ